MTVYDYRIMEHLGSGQFGTVNKGIWQSPAGTVEVAVKTLQSSASQEDRVKFLQEAAINGQFRHPNVVNLLGVITVGEPVSNKRNVCIHDHCIYDTQNHNHTHIIIHSCIVRASMMSMFGLATHHMCLLCFCVTQEMIITELLANGDIRNYLIRQRPV